MSAGGGAGGGVEPMAVLRQGQDERDTSTDRQIVIDPELLALGHESAEEGEEPSEDDDDE